MRLYRSPTVPYPNTSPLDPKEEKKKGLPSRHSIHLSLSVGEKVLRSPHPGLQVNSLLPLEGKLSQTATDLTSSQGQDTGREDEAHGQSGEQVRGRKTKRYHTPGPTLTLEFCIKNTC